MSAGRRIAVPDDLHWRRMHPVSPLLEGWKIVSAIIAVAAIRNADNLIEVYRYVAAHGFDLGDDLLAQLLAERGARFAAEYIGREPNGRRAVGRRRGGLWIRVVREPGSRPASRTTSSYGWLLALSALTGTGEESRDPEPFKAELEGYLDFAVELLLAPQGSLGSPLRLPLLPRERRAGAHPLEGVGQGRLASPRTPHRALPGRAGVRVAAQ